MWGRKKAVEIHDTRGIFKAVQRVVSAFGLTLQEEEDCKQPRTCMRTKVVIVEPLNPYWSTARLNKWRGEVYHEVGHHAPELQDIKAMMEDKGLSYDSLFGRVINVIEDWRNEINGKGMWPGRDDSLSWTQAFHCTNGEKALAKTDLSTVTPDMKLFSDVLAWSYLLRSEWQPDLAIPAIDFAKHTKHSKYDSLSDELKAVDTAEDVYQLARKILEQSDSHDPDEEEAKSKARKSEESDKADDAKGEGDGEGEGEGKPSEGDDGDAEGAEISYKDLMGHSHSDYAASEYADGEKSKIDYDHEKKGDYVPWTKMKVEKARQRPGINISTKAAATNIYENGSSLAGTARRLFQSRTQRRISHNHKAGRLDKRDLYRIPTGSVDVFKRKEPAPDPKGTALFILTDASGSMAGSKFNMTTAAVALLNDAVNPLGVPTYIAAFTENSATGCIHFIMKDFNEKRTSEELIEDYSKIRNSLIQNADGESIMWAYNILRQRPEPRKILLVLSDGSPACDNAGDCYHYTMDVIAHVGKHVETYGVGIMDSNVTDLYPESTVIKKLDHLEQGLLDIIKTKIFT